jgi:hypothetical protein
MAVAQSHALAVGGIAVAALAGGFGIARATGGDTKPPPATSQTEARGLPAVDAPATVKVASLNAVPALPTPKRARRGQSPDRPDPEPSSNPEPSATTAPEPSATAAPPSSTPAPPASTPAPPAPERTPVVGGGTGGEEP